VYQKKKAVLLTFVLCLLIKQFDVQIEYSDRGINLAISAKS
jgi:hypothetical protein